MKRTYRIGWASALACGVIGGLFAAAPVARADVGDGRMEHPQQVPLPTGQFISPTAAPGSVFLRLNPQLPGYPTFRAGWAVKTALSPDGKTLLVMTSGYNIQYFPKGTPDAGNVDPAASNEYIFVYGTAGSNGAKPKLTQIIPVANTFIGLAWMPDGTGFYVSGGTEDAVLIFRGAPGSFAPIGSIALNHTAQIPGVLRGGNGLFIAASPANIALSSDGATMVVANIYNDSISVLDLARQAVRYEYDLRPFNTNGMAGNGVPGGETPFGVALRGNDLAYVSSIRDREVVVVRLGAQGAALVTRIALPGTPNSMVLSADQTKLYVAQDNSDQVAVIDTATNAVVEEIDALAPPGLFAPGKRYTGAGVNNLALSPDGRSLYVTQGGANALAVIGLDGPVPHRVAGLVPTGWYPNAVSVSADGKYLTVVNAKSVPGPVPRNVSYYVDAKAQAQANQYVLQLEQAGLLTLPVPGAADLGTLTAQVAANNLWSVQPDASAAAVMSALHQKIRHVIYIVKENRTFDDLFGDLKNGANSDPRLTQFGAAITPNFHRLQRGFVTLDNFYCAGEVSGNGWPWSTAARESDFGVKTIPLNYAGRVAPYDTEGQNRGMDVGVPTLAGRAAYDPRVPVVLSALPGGAANVLPGTANDAATDGPDGLRESGYLWDSALRAGLTVRNYGFLTSLNRYNGTGRPIEIPKLRNPAAAGVQVSFPSNPTLIPLTDIYFRGFDSAFPDVWRFEEWKREFDQFVANRNLPNLSLVRLMHDHMGNFAGASAGLTTPETQQADNDLAVGMLVDAVAKSPYAKDTLIFALEDDSQDGPDHVDAHRSTAYVIGPYVKRRALVSTRYTTVNMLRTIEDVLGIDHLNVNDAYQAPMADVFDLGNPGWNYNAVASTVLQGTGIVTADNGGEALPGIRFAEGPRVTPIRPASWWIEQTRDFDFSREDRVPADLFNEVLWEGLHPGEPYPALRGGTTLRALPAAAEGPGCRARVDEVAKRLDGVTDARTRRLVEFDLQSARDELGEGDEDECNEAIEHALGLLDRT